jgi:hypothetical protein
MNYVSRSMIIRRGTSQILTSKSKAILYRSGWILSFPESLGAQISRKSAHKVVRLSILYTGCFCLPQNIPGTHFCKRLSRTQGYSASGRIMSITLSSYRALPLPTAPQRVQYEQVASSTTFHYIIYQSILANWTHIWKFFISFF